MNKFYIEMRKDVFDTKLKNKRFVESDFEYICFVDCFGIDTVMLIASINNTSLHIIRAADLIVDIDAMSYLKARDFNTQLFKKYKEVCDIPVHHHTVSHIKRIVEQHAN